jgi:hypothetical protein
MSAVLGYGALLEPEHVRSLAGEEHVRIVGPGFVRGWRRHWNLVYRNGCWEEGRFVDAATGEPVEGGVAFLGVRPDPAAELPVLEIEADDHAVEIIDDEEFMYRRIDVIDAYRRLSGAPVTGPVWLWRDVPEEFPEGRYDGDRVVVAREYHERVRAAAAVLLPDGDGLFEETTEACPWPLADVRWEWR